MESRRNIAQSRRIKGRKKRNVKANRKEWLLDEYYIKQKKKGKKKNKQKIAENRTVGYYNYY